MRLLIQRVSHASVVVGHSTIAKIGRGLVVLIGFGQTDSIDKLQLAINKLLALRLFGTTQGQSGFDLSVVQVLGGILIVPQFTLYADCERGRRPSFSKALAPQEARNLFENFCSLLKASYQPELIAQGEFGAMMRVLLENDGPVTISLEH